MLTQEKVLKKLFFMGQVILYLTWGLLFLFVLWFLYSEDLGRVLIYYNLENLNVF